jgi:hypothetical protein
MSRGPRSRQWTVTWLPDVANRERALPGSAGANVRGVHQFHARLSCRSASRDHVEACSFFAGLHHTVLGARRERQSPDSSHAGRRPLRAARRRAGRRNPRRAARRSDRRARPRGGRSARPRGGRSARPRGGRSARHRRRGRAGRRSRGARRSCRCGAAGGRDRAIAAVATARHQQPNDQGRAQGRPSANPVHGGAPPASPIGFLDTLSVADRPPEPLD